jgi:hypothetical protein
MRIGILIPTRGVVMSSARRRPVETCRTMARRADAAGYDAVWVGDSIVAKPGLEPLTHARLSHWNHHPRATRHGGAAAGPAASGGAGGADRQRRSDIVRARGAGLGVGWSLPFAEREWAACGANRKRRVRLLEEHVELWRTPTRVWTP